MNYSGALLQFNSRHNSCALCCHVSHIFGGCAENGEGRVWMSKHFLRCFLLANLTEIQVFFLKKRKKVKNKKSIPTNQSTKISTWQQNYASSWHSRFNWPEQEITYKICHWKHNWGESQLEFVKCFFNFELIALKDTRKEQNARLCEIYHGL